MATRLKWPTFPVQGVISSKYIGFIQLMAALSATRTNFSATRPWDKAILTTDNFVLKEYKQQDVTECLNLMSEQRMSTNRSNVIYFVGDSRIRQQFFSFLKVKFRFVVERRCIWVWRSRRCQSNSSSPTGKLWVYHRTTKTSTIRAKCSTCAFPVDGGPSSTSSSSTNLRNGPLHQRQPQLFSWLVKYCLKVQFSSCVLERTPNLRNWRTSYVSDYKMDKYSYERNITRLEPALRWLDDSSVCCDWVILASGYNSNLFKWKEKKIILIWK